VLPLFLPQELNVPGTSSLVHSKTNVAKVVLAMVDPINSRHLKYLGVRVIPRDFAPVAANFAGLVGFVRET
jgi:hypothetical protein